MSENLGTDAEDVEGLEADLIVGLRERGIEDPSVQMLLIQWTMLGETDLVAQGGTTDAKIDFELKRAELYRSAGFLDDARLAYEDALTIAIDEGRKDLCDQIKSKYK